MSFLNEAVGQPADGAASDSVSAWSLLALLKGILSRVGGITPSAAAATASLARVASAATTNATSVKAGAGNLYSVAAYNNTGSARFLKLYNKASAPTVGTDTPVWTIPLPASGGFSEAWDIPVAFSIGIAYAITAAAADSDATAIGANDVQGKLTYV